MKLKNTETTIGTALLIRGDSLEYCKRLPFGSQDLIIIDPPFDWPEEDILPWIDEAVRLLSPKGNIVCLNMSLRMIELHSLIKIKTLDSSKFNLYKKLQLIDPIIVQQKTAIPRLHGLAQQTMMLAVYTKDLGSRALYRRAKNQAKAFSPEKVGLVTDQWVERLHRPGSNEKIKHIQGFIGEPYNHGTCTAEWVAEKILDCYARPGDKVLDMFGGRGTFPSLCVQENIDCISIELKPKNYLSMKDKCTHKLKKRNKELAKHARKFVEKATNTYTTVEDKNGRKENAQSKVKLSQHEESKI